MLGRLKFELDELVEEMLSYIPEEMFIWDDTTFLDPAMGGGQFVKGIEKKLRSYGHSDENIKSRVFGFESNRMRINFAVNKNNLVGTYAKGGLEEMGEKKFDVIVGNPPFQDGSKLLYPKFFKISLKLAETVAFIMPLNLESNHDKLRHHNILIKKHNQLISSNISDRFNVGLNNIYYVIANRHIENDYEDYQDPLEKMDLLYPDRRRLSTILGDTNLSKKEYFDENGIEIISKIYKNDQIIRKKFKKEIVEKSNKWIKSPWAVFINHTPSLGRFNCVAIKNPKMSWTMHVFAFECDSEDDALELKKWIQSKEIVDEVKKMLSAKNAHTISKAMIERLPYYK